MILKDFSYTADLQKAAQKNKWNDTITQYSSTSPSIQDLVQTPIEINSFSLKHSLCYLLQLPKTLYYFLVTQEENQKKGKQEFQITIYSFKKIDGSYLSLVLKDLRGTPTCITAGFLAEKNEQKEPKDQKQESEPKPPIYTIVALVGLKEGFIKTIKLKSSRQGVQTDVDSTKIQQKPIISIIAADKKYYNQKNICFILLQDSKIFIYNFLIKQTIAIYQPPILSHDFAICMDLHISGNYIATCTKSGQIFFWELSEKTLEVIQKSQQRIQKDKNKIKGKYKAQMQDEEIQWKFKAKDRDISVFPMYAIHSASINGLKWIGFYGNLLALVSRTGLFRLIAINFQIRDEFIILIEYQIEKGQSISTVQLFPNLQMLVVTKCKQYVSLISEGEEKKKNQQMIIRFKEKMLKKNDYNSKMNVNCYAPVVGKQCLIEKIQFGSELKVQKVKRVRFVRQTTRNIVDLKYTIINSDGYFILGGNENQFYIGPCSAYFSQYS